MTHDDTLVVGAGPAGLAVSASLRHQGVPHVIVDRSGGVGTTWRRHYDRLHLHTAKWHSALPFSPWPGDAPRYPSRDAVVHYLERYADEHQVSPCFDVEVLSIARAGDRFAVETTRGTLRPRTVVVASGANAVPRMPAIDGLEGFAGDVIHTRSYRNAGPFAGRRTLVVGCGNSGAEVALDLAEHGVDVSMVVRSPVHVVPRDILGRPIQEAVIAMSVLPLAVRDRLAAAVVGLAVGDLSRWGIVRPRQGPLRSIEQQNRIPMLDVGTIAQVKSGGIRITAAVSSVQASTVRFADGTSEPFEAIICATGYHHELGRFVAGWDAMADGLGLPLPAAAAPHASNLFFVGFRPAAGGALRQMGREALAVAARVG